jgi:lipopolysaccharide/colanic/teichoic acid biosynthesis glycosyltransferase
VAHLGKKKAAEMGFGRSGGRVVFERRARESRFPHEVNSAEEFAVILERERARADRNGHGFSLVTFKVDGASRAFEDRLKQVLDGRLRLTDEMGWFDGQRIGVLLFNTHREGAWNYANRVREAMTAGGEWAEFGVYTYPASWPGGVAEKGRPAKEAECARAAAEPPGVAMEPVVDPFKRDPLPFWKRALDLMVAPVVLLVFSPLMAALALAVKLSSVGPVFFKQERAGIRGRAFVCWKFRTMVADAEAQKKDLLQYNERSGVAFKMKNDPRVTRVGRFLRKTSLDELPQLFNVLRGEMSLVGPRPLPVAEAMQQDTWHNMRLEVAPGMTCLWQVSARHKSSFDTWARLDIEYVRNRSLWLDLKLLVLTIPAVLSRRGAH